MGKQRPRTPTGRIRRRRRSRRRRRRRSRPHVPVRLRRAPTPTATRWRRRWPNSAQVRECVARQMFRVVGRAQRRRHVQRADRTAVNASEAFIDVWKQLPRATGQVRRDAGRLRPQPPVRQTEPPVKRSPDPPFVPSRRRRRRHGSAVLRPARGLGGPRGRRDAPAALRRHLSPARRRRRAVRACSRATPRATSASPTLERRPVLAAAVRRRRDVRQELQEQDHRRRGHRPHVERQRALDGGHDPDRQLHRLATKPKNSSLDQFLAVEQKLGAATKVTSIALGVGNDTTDAGWTLSYGPGGVALPKIIDPAKAWDTLFSGFAATSDPNTAAAEARAQARWARAWSTSCIGDVKRLNARLATTEKLKLQQHLDSMSDLSKRYRRDDGQRRRRRLVLAGEARRRTRPRCRQYNGGEPYFDAITDMFIDMLAQAFACDVTRFATLLMNDLSYAGNPLGLPADNHGSVAHTYSGSAIGSDGHPVGAGNAVDLGSAGEVQPLLLRQGRALHAEARRAGRARQHPHLRQQRHGEPRPSTARATCRRCSRAAPTASSAWAAASRPPPTARPPHPGARPGDKDFVGVTNNKHPGRDRPGLRPHRRQQLRHPVEHRAGTDRRAAECAERGRVAAARSRPGPSARHRRSTREAPPRWHVASETAQRVQAR